MNPWGIEAAASSRQWVCKKLARVWHWGPGLTSRSPDQPPPSPPFLGGILFIFHRVRGGGPGSTPFFRTNIIEEKEREMEREEKYNYTKREKLHIYWCYHRARNIYTLLTNKKNQQKYSLKSRILMFYDFHITEYSKQNTVPMAVACILLSLTFLRISLLNPALQTMF